MVMIGTMIAIFLAASQKYSAGKRIRLRAIDAIKTSNVVDKVNFRTCAFDVIFKISPQLLVRRLSSEFLSTNC